MDLTVSKILRRSLSVLLIGGLLLLCGGCKTQGTGDEPVQVVATTYPIYALTCAVSAGVDDISVSRLSTGQVSCLHDYTLTVSDMRHLERADLLLLNGAGLEAFLSVVLDELSATAIDCSCSVDFMETDGEDDPHYWMDPRNAVQMTYAIAQGLSQADPDHAEIYDANALLISDALLCEYELWTVELSGLSFPYLITFHDGFRYFAEAFGLELLFAVEEEDGATASAKDILLASTLVKEYHLPYIFMESNGSGAAARAVSGETGAHIATLSMLMDGTEHSALDDDLSTTEILNAMYLTPMGQNIKTLQEVLK